MPPVPPALAVAWTAQLLVGLILALCIPGEASVLVRVMQHIVAATTATYVIARRAPDKPRLAEFMPWSLTGPAIFFLALLVVPAGTFADHPAALSTVATMGMAAFLLPRTALVLSRAANLAQRVLRGQGKG